MLVPALQGAAARPDDYADTPVPRDLDTYDDADLGLLATLVHRVTEEPLNGVATLFFFLAIAHTFMTGTFRRMAHNVEEKHEAWVREQASKGNHLPLGPDGRHVSIKAEVLHFLGEVEAVFGLWVLPLMIAITGFYGYMAVAEFIDIIQFKYVEPMFVVVIMAIASTRPVLHFAEVCLRQFAKLGGGTPFAWWAAILIVAPVLGSFITEPAAMTIAALLLSRQFYDLDPSPRFKYATIGLLFVNVSVGGTLTHFAAPPVLMVAGAWGWDIAFMFSHFGWKAVVGIIIATGLYGWMFRKEFVALKAKAAASAAEARKQPENMPWWIIVVVLGFLAWTVLNLHHPALFIGGFLFFLAFTQATANHQDDVQIRGPLLVGFFLAGLVTHGVLQQWWISPVLSALGEWPLFVGATVLTAFNDNAAITFLASQVPSFDPHLAKDLARAEVLEYAVVAGAVTGGGLTVIANAPNPAGQSLLQKYFANGVSPLWLVVGAFIPTLIMGACFMFLPHF